MKEGSFRGGVHPPGRKEATAGSPTTWAPLPPVLVVPMSQHLGAPCEPLVSVGDRVERGQRIGDVDAPVSAPVHSPVAGTVEEVTTRLTIPGTRVACVVIEADADQDLASWVPVDAADVVSVVRAAGIVGMGGAAFPSSVKLTPPKGLSVDTVIVNGCECESYLTCDHRLMLEEPERIVRGARIVAEAVGASRVVIAVEDNKPDAIASVRSCVTDGLEVQGLPTKYPQGAEKQLIRAVLGREVPHGQLPAAAGALVHNVATVAAIADAVDARKPLMERIVTVSGRVARPGNYRVLVGTLVRDLIEHAGGFVGEVARVIAGGPMTGLALGSLDVPITKGTSGIVALGPEEIAPAVSADQPCIRCGRCSEGCPMFLQPYLIATYANREVWARTEPLHALDCIECGVCSYVCPTRRPLLPLIRLAKAALLAKGVRP